MSRASVRAYYRGKTRALLAKYGPGPRVHFHVGFADASQADSDDPLELRRRMVASQEAVIEESGRAFAESGALSGGRLLDVGCGLGGGSLHWAERYGARVVALTHVADHARIVRCFARRVGLDDRVEPVVADAHALPADHAFDAAIAIESSCYLDRGAWFQALRGALRPGGYVFLVDGFLGDPSAKREFDAYWHTDLAPLDHYLAAASTAGFVLEKLDRLNSRAVGFWELSRAWTRVRMGEVREAGGERERLARSLVAHERFQSMYAEGQVEYLRLAFRL